MADRGDGRDHYRRVGWWTGERLVDRLRDTDPGSQEEAQQLIDARAAMMSRARAFVEQKFELFGRGATDDFMDDFVSRKSMSQLDRRDMAASAHLFADDAVFHYFNPNLPDLQGDHLGPGGVRAFFEAVAEKSHGTFRIEPVTATWFPDHDSST